MSHGPGGLPGGGTPIFLFGPGCSNRRARVDVFGREGRSIMLVIVLLKVRI